MLLEHESFCQLFQSSWHFQVQRSKGNTCHITILRDETTSVFKLQPLISIMRTALFPSEISSIRKFRRNWNTSQLRYLYQHSKVILVRNPNTLYGDIKERKFHSAELGRRNFRQLDQLYYNAFVGGRTLPAGLLTWPIVNREHRREGWTPLNVTSVE